MVTKKSKFLSWAVLALFLLSPTGSFAQSIPGPSVSGGTSATIVPPLPLPTGAATEATLGSIDTELGLQGTALGSIDTKLTDNATATLQSSGNALLTTIDADTSSLAGTVSGSEQQVDVVTSALPTGAATEATLSTIDSDTSSLAGTVSGTEQQVDIVASLPAGTNNIGDVDVLTLPSIPAGTNNIGDVDIASFPADPERELHAAASSSGDGTTIDISGAVAVLVHATTDGTWNRTATITFQGGIGGGALSEFRRLPYFEYQDAGSALTAMYKQAFNTVNLQTNSNDQGGWLVDVTGFQTFKVPISITAGSTGSVEIHAHVVYNGGRVHNAAAALSNTPDGLNTGVPDYSLQVAGIDQIGAAEILPIQDYSSTLNDHALPIAGVVDQVANNSYTDGQGEAPHLNPQGALWVALIDEDGNEVIADGSGLMVQLGNLCATGTSALCNQLNAASAASSRGVMGLGIFREDITPPSTFADGDFISATYGFLGGLRVEEEVPYRSATGGLIGIDDQVDQNEWSGTVSVTLPFSAVVASGDLEQVCVRTAENGTGAILTPVGKIFVFGGTAPTITAGDTVLTAAEWDSVRGIIEVAVADYQSDANGAVACKTVDIAMSETSGITLAFFNEDATSFNDAAGDDETLNLQGSVRWENLRGGS